MHWNINRWLKLHIRGKLAIAFTGLSILPVLVVALWGISYNVKSLRYIAVEGLKHDLFTIRGRLEYFIQGLEDNLYYITGSASFKRFVLTMQRGDHEMMTRSVDVLVSELMAFARRRHLFYQIKFVSSEGDEVFVIEHRNGRYDRLPESKLNTLGTSFYRYLVKKIPHNSVTFVPVELTQRDGTELIPAISCIYPVYRPRYVGILILQIYAQDFFRIVEQDTAHVQSGTLMLVNAEGFYLYHSQKKKNWNQLVASKDSLNLTVDYGADVARRLLSGRSGVVFEVKDEIIACAPLFNDELGLNIRYTLLKSVSKPEIFAPISDFTKLFAGLIGFFLFTSLFLSYLATHQFTGPIEKLKREAQVIAQGNYHSRVDVKTYDEIEDLARQFNIMAESLEQREEEITRHKEHLETLVQERTRELESEKDKLQVILDNVPSGFILLDKDFRIVAASAALKSITNEPVDDIIGQRCRDVIGDGHLCSGCPAEETFTTGRMETRLVRHVTTNGEERYLEFTSVPLRKNGQVEQVLEIITDVTERKRLQDQLIHSEKMAATGEMAAVIAHEMRNSLTSVRMILQLLSENHQVADSDRESLEVALDSMARMERVVKDLLQLARPARLEKSKENVNDIVQDSIELAKHQIVRKGIDLEMDLEPQLPQIEVDREHIKEALVNLILNASQAIESSGKIQIRSRLTRLNKRLRDLGEVRVVANDKVEAGVQEVVLEKGKPVIQVEVSDTGCGIPPEHLNRIFDPFFTTKTNGTGLGLSFVKRVANEHGGLVQAQSRVGKGSRFTIYIPVDANQQSKTTFSLRSSVQMSG